MSRWLVVGLVCLGFSFVASEASALSCQRRIISRGAPQYRVQRYCGQPASRHERVVERTTQVLTRDAYGQLVSRGRTDAVLVETWVYDFGPRRLLQVLTFEHGILVNLDTDGYGSSAGSLPRKVDVAPDYGRVDGKDPTRALKRRRERLLRG